MEINEICKWIHSQHGIGRSYNICLSDFVYKDKTNDTNMIQYFVMHGLGIHI